MRHPFLLTIIIIVHCTYAFSQKQTFSVSGSVYDASDMSPVEYASVAIFKMPDSLLITGAITGLEGSF